VTEFIVNGSVEDALKRIEEGNTPSFWTHANITTMIIGLVLGMKYLHSCDVIHRDLKPANLLIDDRIRIRICDFGAAKFEGLSTRLAIGTPAYIAPEIMDGAVPTKKVDVFSFGLIVCELLVGKSVFPNNAPSMQIVKLHFQKYRPEIPDWISRPVGKLIQECWSEDPEIRPSFEKIWDVLEGVRFTFFDDVVPKVVNDFVSEVKRQTGSI
jgi:serine/threonine protein kinase